MNEFEIRPSEDHRCGIQDEELQTIPIEAIHILRRHIMFPVIYKVPRRLRQVNEKAYEPSVISIGPYHHNKEHLKVMEDIKERFFNTKARDRKDILRATIREKEDRIRNCYVQIEELTTDQLVEMVVLDGFFMVQFLRGIHPTFVLEQKYIEDEIRHDLLLLENQLPFFVLEEIYKIMIQNEVTREEFADLALKYFDHLIGDAKRVYPIPNHLLGLIHDSTRWFPSNGTKQEDEETKDQLKKAKCECIPCGRDQEETAKGESARGTEYSKRNENWWEKAKCVRKFISCRRKQEETGKNAKRGNFIRCARELEEAGISFEKRDEKKDKCGALDIEFKRNCRKPKLRIPQFMVDDGTESQLRNLIAFEQSFPRNKPNYVFDFVKFIDQLINSEKDVQLLCNSDIIENWLGDYDAVAKVFNRLLEDTYESPDNFYYSGIFEQVNDHCDNRCNKHMANLRRTYFNSPWALLSFLAALILLFLTITQTMIALLTIHCHSCVVLFIVFCVLLLVIGVFLYLCLG